MLYSVFFPLMCWTDKLNISDKDSQIYKAWFFLHLDLYTTLQCLHRHTLFEGRINWEIGRKRFSTFSFAKTICLETIQTQNIITSFLVVKGIYYHFLHLFWVFFFCFLYIFVWNKTTCLAKQKLSTHMNPQMEGNSDCHCYQNHYM